MCPVRHAIAAGIIAGLFSLASSTAARAQRPAAPRLPDVVDYEFTIDLPDTGSVIKGRAVLTVHRAEPADSLRLDLIAMQVDSVLVNRRTVSFSRDSATIGVPLPPGSSDTLRIEVQYGGAPRDGLIVRTAAGRWSAFGDNWPQRARYWLPTVDRPSDKATVTWIVHAPSDRTVIANGELRDSASGERGSAVRSDGPSTRGGPALRQWVWRESRPVPTYVMVIGAARMISLDLGPTACGLRDGSGCVRQRVFVAPEDSALLPGPFARAGDMVSFFARLIAPFPYERLDHVASSTRFGGMENATEIFYDGRAVHARSLGEGTVAHETAHQWFGDAVTEARFADLWLSEGFATYWAALWTQHASGDSAFKDEMRRLRREVIASPVSAMRPVIDTTATDYLQLLNTNSYQKGGWVLHMLRGMLGDSAFFRGVREYYVAHRHGNAVSDDLRSALERASGRPLDSFFDQWLRRPGWPELRTRWRYDEASHRVTLYVEQGARFTPYRFPLTVAIVDGDGRVRKLTVAVDAAPSQEIVLPVALDRAPRSLDLDPDVELLASFAAP